MKKGWDFVPCDGIYKLKFRRHKDNTDFSGKRIETFKITKTTEFTIKDIVLCVAFLCNKRWIQTKLDSNKKGTLTFSYYLHGPQW